MLKIRLGDCWTDQAPHYIGLVIIFISDAIHEYEASNDLRYYYIKCEDVSKPIRIINAAMTWLFHINFDLLQISNFQSKREACLWYCERCGNVFIEVRQVR